MREREREREKEGERERGGGREREREKRGKEREGREREREHRAGWGGANTKEFKSVSLYLSTFGPEIHSHVVGTLSKQPTSNKWGGGVCWLLDVPATC